VSPLEPGRQPWLGQDALRWLAHGAIVCGPHQSFHRCRPFEEAATNAIRHSGSERDVEISLRFAEGDL
jgi:hypothetical protein